MSSHVELNPDDDVLGLSLGMKALRLALTQKTHKTGTVRIPTGGDTDIIIGDSATDGVNRVDQDGNQLPLVDTSDIDKAAQDAQRAADDASKAAQAASDKADKMRADLQAEVDANRKTTDSAIAAVDAKADKTRSDLESQATTLKAGIAAVDAKTDQVKADGEKLSQKVESDKAELDRSMSVLDEKTSDLSDKGDQLAGRISDVTTTVNGHTSKLSELSTRIEGVASDGQATTRSLTELKQTVTGVSSTVSQTTKTASDALSKASQVEQTANGIKATLSKDYTSTADADRKYSTKTELKTTADGLQADIAKSQQTADGAVTKANAAQTTADGVKATLSKDYTSTKDADLKYSTKAELSATSESLSSSLSSVEQTADGAVTAASKAQQTADGVSLNLSKNYQTKTQADTTYATKTSLKATSDSLTASISSTAKTAQSAVDKATSLEQNLDGFKTSVAKTYTTKTDFDGLSIGGTNLCPKSNPRNRSLANASKDPSTGEITGTVPANANTTWGAAVTPGDSTHLKTPYGRRCVISFDVWSELDATLVVDVNNMPESGAAWNGHDNDGSRGGVELTTTTTTTNGALSRSIPAKQWTRMWFTYANTNAKNTGKTDIFDSSTIGLRPLSAAYQVRFRNFKFELGSRPTEYSPCPSDLQPAGDYSTKTELSQTADGIKAQVSEVSKTASGAMDKATTVEQTANGLSTRITEQAKTLDATTKTANEAKSTADSNKQTISQVKSTADGAVTRIASVEQNLSGFKQTVAQTYTTKTDFNDLSIGGTNLIAGSKELLSDSNFSGSFLYRAKVADSIPGFAGFYFRGNSGVKGTGDSCSWTIHNCRPGDRYTFSFYAGAYQSNHIRTYFYGPSGYMGARVVASSKHPSEFTGSNYSDGNYDHDLAASDGNGKLIWITYECDPNYKGSVTDKYILIRTDSSVVGSKIWISKPKMEKGSKHTDWSPAPEDVQTAGDYATNSALTQTASQIRGEVSEKYQSKSGMSTYATNSALTQKADEITGKVQEVAKTAQGNTTTISQVSQKADRINTTLSQKIDGKADVSRVSSLEQNLDGFETSVAKTYQPKDGMGAYATTSQLQQTASSIKSEVASTYTTQTATETLRKSSTRTFTISGAAGKAKWVKLGYLTSNGDSSSVLLHVYSGNGYNGQASQNAEFEIFIKDGFQSASSPTKAFGVSVNRIRNADGVKVKVMAFNATTCDVWAYLPWMYWNGHYTLQGDYKAWQDGPNCAGTRIQDAEPTSGTMQDLAYDTLSTRSYVDQTSKTVALGVVQSYKGSDGSGIATKSDITAAKNSITSSVSSTYATKSGVTQEISSKITQNNNSLDVKFSTKTETKTAQDTANTAKSNASDAQSRVGNLEGCIQLTSAGVRAGRRSNGVFNGVSALVNTDGSFDLLDKDGNLLTRINQHRFQVTGDNGVGSGYVSLSQNGINITVQPTADTSNTYHIQVGAGGIGITAPDGSSIECSKSGGLNIETVRYGKISIGAGGLQFTNDQGWGLKLSAAGWNIKWAGNHTLATGPTAGKLYIDGHEIVTK